MSMEAVEPSMDAAEVLLFDLKSTRPTDSCFQGTSCENLMMYGGLYQHTRVVLYISCMGKNIHLPRHRKCSCYLAWGIKYI